MELNAWNILQLVIGTGEQGERTKRTLVACQLYSSSHAGREIHQVHSNEASPLTLKAHSAEPGRGQFGCGVIASLLHRNHGEPRRGG